MGGSIEIRGARENNLRCVDVKVPKHAITNFTGVSGSGKSSIVFDTIATEAQRQLYENFTMFVRNFLPKYPPPAADAIENLNMAVVVDQKPLGGGSHSTVGTVTDIYTADWIIDIGPEGRSKGGTVVFEGTPAALAKDKRSITAKYVRGE